MPIYQPYVPLVDAFDEWKREYPGQWHPQPELRTRYAKKKINPAYYWTVNVKDIVVHENENAMKELQDELTKFLNDELTKNALKAEEDFLVKTIQQHQERARIRFESLELPKIKGMIGGSIREELSGVRAEFLDHPERFPHKCPRCGSQAYVGFSSVDCSKVGCG